MGWRQGLGRRQSRRSDTKAHDPSRIVNRREPAEPGESEDGSDCQKNIQLFFFLSFLFLFIFYFLRRVEGRQGDVRTGMNKRQCPLWLQTSGLPSNLCVGVNKPIIMYLFMNPKGGNITLVQLSGWRGSKAQAGRKRQPPSCSISPAGHNL